MKKTKKIFCYGDSITWGYSFKDGSRYDYDLTWSSVMEKSLGKDYIIKSSPKLLQEEQPAGMFRLHLTETTKNTCRC